MPLVALIAAAALNLGQSAAGRARTKKLRPLAYIRRPFKGERGSVRSEKPGDPKTASRIESERVKMA